MKGYMGLLKCRYCGQEVPASCTVEEDADGIERLVSWKSAWQQAFRMHRASNPKCRKAWEEAGKLLRQE